MTLTQVQPQANALAVTVNSNLPADLPPERLAWILQKMCEIRYFEEKAEELYVRGLVHGAMHLSIGQEASSVGSIAALRPDDLIIHHHRGHGHTLAPVVAESEAFDYLDAPIRRLAGRDIPIPYNRNLERLGGLKAKPDDVIPVAQVIAYILEPGETVPGQTEAGPGPAPAVTPVVPIPAETPVIAPEAASPAGEANGKVRATPAARHPYLNASLQDGHINLWEDVHLGIAMSLEDYLIVPVIRAAQTRNLEQFVTILGDLIERARVKRLTPSEMSGSTFTISNLGMFGIESFTAIINPPEAAILAVGKMVDTPVKGAEGIEFRPMINLTLAVDHRIADGATAARFLAELKTTLENPYLLI